MTKDKIFGFENWFKKPVQIKAKKMQEPFTVKTLEGTMNGKAGDYLIIGVKGEQYPCAKEIFELTYTKERSILVSVTEKVIKKTKESEPSGMIDRYFKYGVEYACDFIEKELGLSEKKVVSNDKKER